MSVSEVDTDVARGEAAGHRRGAAGADTDDSSPWPGVLEPTADAGSKCAVSNLNEGKVDRSKGFQFEGDRSRAFGHLRAKPVNDKQSILARRGVHLGRPAGLFCYMDAGSQRTHSRDLGGWDLGRDERFDGGASRAGGVGKALSEVPGGRADPRLDRIQFLGEQPCSTPLEAADGRNRFVLDHGFAVKRSAQRIADELRRLQKRLVDPLRGGRDPFGGEIRDVIVAIHDAEGMLNSFGFHSASVRMPG